MARSGFIDGAPASVLPRVFALAPGEVGAVDGPDFVGLVVLDTVHDAAPDDPARMALYQALSQRLGQDMAQDIFGLYAARVQAQAEIQLNTAAVDAVNAQMR
jgi:peptidyl-prolyl cis-trans isomerase D